MLWCCVCVISFLAHKNYKTNKTICTKRTWQYCFYRGETDFTGSVIKRQCGWNWISAANIEEKNEWICERWMNAPMHRDWKQNKFCDFFFSLFYGRANKDDNRSILWWLALVWMTFEFQQEIIWPQLTSIISQFCSLLIESLNAKVLTNTDKISNFDIDKSAKYLYVYRFQSSDMLIQKLMQRIRNMDGWHYDNRRVLCYAYLLPASALAIERGKRTGCGIGICISCNSTSCSQHNILVCYLFFFSVFESV